MGNYNDLEVFQKSRQLAIEVILVLKSMKGEYWLRDQVSRSALSIPSNIAESEGRFSNKQSIQFLHYALGSAFELATQLGIMAEIKFVEKKAGDQLIEKTNIVAIKLRKLISYRMKNMRTIELPEIDI